MAAKAKWQRIKGANNKIEAPGNNLYGFFKGWLPLRLISVLGPYRITM
jgi:hypothetical protein